MKRKIPLASGHMVERGRGLRQVMTAAERRLWEWLRGRRCGGMKFRRQQPVGPYVVDFLCVEAGLAVEVDGWSRIGMEEPDQERQAYLERQGLRVVRFSNQRVLEETDAVVAEIARSAGRS